MNKNCSSVFKMFPEMYASASPYLLPCSGSESELSEDEEEEDDEDDDEEEEELELPCQLFFSFSSIPACPFTGFFAVFGCSGSRGDRDAVDWPR